MKEIQIIQLLALDAAHVVEGVLTDAQTVKGEGMLLTAIQQEMAQAICDGVLAFFGIRG
jgi:hypothetical protein